MNELSRTKLKLKTLLSEELPIQQLFFDFVNIQFGGMIPEGSIEYYITQLKTMYNSKIKSLQPEEKFKQTEIEYNDNRTTEN